jgi:hypothetical protein
VESARSKPPTRDARFNQKRNELVFTGIFI